MGCNCKKQKIQSQPAPAVVKITEQPKTINVGLTDTQNDLVQKIVEKLQEN